MAIPRPGVLERVAGAIAKALNLVRPTVESFRLGGNFGSDFAAQKPFDSKHAMSAAQANVWYFAAINAIASDLASLPWKVTVEGRDGKRVRLDDHPVIRMLEKPNPQQVGELFWRQIVYDWKTDGNAYLLMLDGPRSMPVVGLERLHPASTSVVPDKQGHPAGFEHDLGGVPVTYHPEQVAHLRNFSWRDDERGVYGMGAVQPLNRDLMADAAAAEGAAKASMKGRPDFLLTPADAGTSWSDKVIKLITHQVNRMLGKSFGGALVLGGHVKATPLSWSLRDVEFQSVRTMARDGVLAGLGVPPAKVGLPTANYATQQQQMASYWQDRVADARMLGAVVTQIARRFDPSLPTIRVEKDFSQVRWLQFDRTERLSRVQQWVYLGMDPMDAAQYEGFEDAPKFAPMASSLPPFLPAADPAGNAPDGGSDDDDGNDDADDADDGREPTPGGGTRVVELATLFPRRRVVSLAERDAEWKGMHEDVLWPADRGIQRVAQAALAAQAERMAIRTRDVLSQEAKTIVSGNVVQRIEASGVLLAILQNADELLWMLEAFGPTMQEAMAKSFAREKRRIGLRAGSINPGTAKGLVSKHVQYTQDFTERVITDTVERGLAEGLDADAIAERVLNAQVFRPVRAQRIAQTSATALVSTGTDEAIAAAAAAGMDIRGKMWLSARDAAVRDTHQRGSGLDGQVVGPGELFRSPSGATGPGPGRMSSTDENMNCRCVTIAAL